MSRTRLTVTSSMNKNEPERDTAAFQVKTVREDEAALKRPIVYCCQSGVRTIVPTVVFVLVGVTEVCKDIVVTVAPGDFAQKEIRRRSARVVVTATCVVKICEPPELTGGKRREESPTRSASDESVPP